MNTTSLRTPVSAARPVPLYEVAYAAGRVALAVLFIWSGYTKLAFMDGNVGYMKAYGMPLADILIWPAALVELAAGAAIAIGFKARWAALALIAFTAVATFVFHAYWSVPTDQMLNQQIHFMKNVAAIGGLLMVFAHGDGRIALGRG